MSETFSPDNLLTGDFPVVVDNTHIIAGGEVVVRGSVLGKVTSGGKLKVLNHVASDGSQNPFAVALEDVDASVAGVSVSGVSYGAIALSGGFNSNAISFGEGSSTTAATVKDAMRDLSMFLKDPTAPVNA